MLFTTSAGIGIDYTETGNANGPTLVLLHGMGEGGVSWNSVLPDLEAGHRVLNVTFRGHSPSDYPGEYSYELMLLDVENLLDSLAPGPSVVLGHSLGGIVAFMLAVGRPDLVGKLIVEDVAPGPPREPRPIPDRPEHELPFDWDMFLAIRPQVDAGSLELLARLDEVRAPTLIIGGGETSHVPQSWLTDAAARIPDAEVITLGGGHAVHEELPREFADTVLGWLDHHPSLP